MKKSTEERRWTTTEPAATLLVEMLQQLGFTCALCGDWASWMYGEFRIPNKVEAVVFMSRGPFPSVDALKETIAGKSNGRFHIVPVNFAHPQGNSVGLCYRHELVLPGKKTVSVELTYCHDAKTEQVWYLHGFPLAPLSFLLLRKLANWEGAAKRQRRVGTDIRQLLVMFEMYRPDGVPFSSELHESSRQRVQAFCAAFPECAHTWSKLGFGPSLVDTPRAAAGPPPQLDEFPRALGFLGHDTEQLMIENPSRLQMVFLAGLTTVGMLHRLGFSCAIYGSLACFLYGNVREPNDVDILVLPPLRSTVSIEHLKSAIEQLDPVHFYLIPSKKPGATYKLLHYRLNASGVQTSCKVDVVFPGTLHLPALLKTQIFWDEGLPLVPFSLLLLQKLQGWDDHRISGEVIKRLKQKTDAEDVRRLLELSGTVSLRSTRPWSDRLLFDEEFEASSRERVRLYCAMFPECAESWALLGFTDFSGSTTDVHNN